MNDLAIKPAFGPTPGRRPTWIEIDLGALAHNFRLIRKTVGPDVQVMAVVKANAYGHGAVECAERLATESADWFGVALPEEGVELRQAGIAQPILCLGGFWPGQESMILQHQLTPVVYGVEMVAALNAASVAAAVVTPVHLKVDTGMGRMGVRMDHLTEFLGAIAGLRNIEIAGVMSHLASADDPAFDSFTAKQEERFAGAVRLVRDAGWDPKILHLANSAGALAHPMARGNLVRPGGILYGMWRDILPPAMEPWNLRAVMSWRSRIGLLKHVPAGEDLGYGCTFRTERNSVIATLPVGYHDGYLRSLSNQGQVIIRGAFAPVVGRVSMDLTMVDVTDIPDVALHDRVTLMGHDGDVTIVAEQLAGLTGTLSYEITCGISERVPRYYSN
jgi:alanine racemase